MNQPGHIFALALFGAIGVSHTLRPAIWREYVAWLAGQHHAGVALYASLHALPGAMMLALAGTEHWTGWVLTVVGGLFVVKAAIYCLVPEVGLRSMERGVALAVSRWSGAGVLLLAIAAVGGWGAMR